MIRKQLEQLVAEGESERLEFKRSTGELRAACEALCGMLNGNGGQVLLGVSDHGRLLGQQISDQTLREVAAELARIEPSSSIIQTRIKIDETNSRELEIGLCTGS